ncbi:hypothetical protein [Bacillus sp. AFS017336]|uniref:hypothetical protein n=1 Tax=Bacillus sp. AFS017336 TaxID=2033489 RepID=UPI000BF171C9|nr:hypothetical protein [Bacillus sp. AFS017336]PEL03940.1 hypothetical protein CN601_21830 [Bacillus sp. AFS017336]
MTCKLFYNKNGVTIQTPRQTKRFRSKTDQLFNERDLFKFIDIDYTKYYSFTRNWNDDYSNIERESH